MKVLLTGATGYIGSAVAERLRAAGHTVLGLARSEEAEARLRRFQVEPVRGDLNDPAGVARVASAADGVIHTAFIHDFGKFAEAVAVERRLIAALTDALAGTGKPLVATSGSGVLGDTGARVVAEDAPIDTASPLGVRAEAEQDVLRAAQRGVRSMVLRFPIQVYGHGGSVFIPWLIGDARRSGVARYIGEGANRTSAVHVDDAADLYLVALEKGQAGTLYHGSGEQGITIRSLAEAVGGLVGCPVESITRQEADDLWGPAMVAFWSINNQIDSSRAIHDLGWQPKATPTLLDDLRHGSYRTQP